MLTRVVAGPGVSTSGGSASSPTLLNKRMAALATAADGDLACGVAMALTPAADSYVEVVVNGISIGDIGDGTKVAAACYFSGDGGATARTWSAIAAGDQLYWQGSVAGYELAVTDEIDFLYEAI